MKAATEKYQTEISKIDRSIELLSGKKIAEIEPEYCYDDENPDYIKGSTEEM